MQKRALASSRFADDSNVLIRFNGQINAFQSLDRLRSDGIDLAHTAQDNYVRDVSLSSQFHKYLNPAPGSCLAAINEGYSVANILSPHAQRAIIAYSVGRNRTGNLFW